VSAITQLSQVASLRAVRAQSGQPRGKVPTGPFQFFLTSRRGKWRASRGEIVMALMSWNPSMSVGVHVLDEDHKKLIAMINELHASMLQGHSNDVIGGVLRKLANYTVEHFQREEKMFAETHYAGAAAHKREHEKLKGQVMAEIQKFQSGTQGLGMETLSFLRDWLKHHIQESDKSYSSHLNSHNVH
jgi:hemerythrin-like metal-binding protein